MADISQSVCLNHPETPAVIRCATCGKPICEKCIVNMNGSAYCSTQCAVNAANSSGRVNEVLESKKRADSKSKGKFIVVLIILAALAAGGYWYYQNNQAKVQRAIKKTERKLRRAENSVKADAREAKKEIQKNLPGDSKYKKDRENLVK